MSVNRKPVKQIMIQHRVEYYTVVFIKRKFPPMALMETPAFSLQNQLENWIGTIVFWHWKIGRQYRTVVPERRERKMISAFTKSTSCLEEAGRGDTFYTVAQRWGAQADCNGLAESRQQSAFREVKITGICGAEF